MKPVALFVCLCVSVACEVFGQENAYTFTYVVDARANPRQAWTISDGRRTPVASILAPDGSRFDFPADEVVLRPKSNVELHSLLAKYKGRVLRGVSETFAIPPDSRTPPPSGWYLVKVDVRRSPVADLSANMSRLGISGQHTFSSPDAAKLTALVAREKTLGLPISPNLMLYDHDAIRETNILEHRDGLGGFVDFANLPFMTETRNLAGGQLGIGVVRAWDYLRYKGIPFGPKPWTRPIVAIIDGGFALDAAGDPQFANLDFEMGNRPLQFNVVEMTPSAGGTNPNTCTGGSPCPWHATQVFSTAAAMPRNRFGAAGTGGDVVKPMLIRSRIAAFDAGDAVRGAALHGAAVANMSFGASCLGQTCGIFFDGLAQLQDNINFAKAWNNTVVVSSAGNSNEGDNEKFDNVPCTLDNVICVGSILSSGLANAQTNPGGFYNSGSGTRVDIWAPDAIPTTPNPASIAANPIAVGFNALPVFFGTSAAAPFVSGVIGLMKALNPKLTPEQTLTILQTTAQKSPDPKVVPGYVDAFNAVLATSPNQPPTIKIISPAQGASILWGKQFQLVSSVDDPEQSPAVDLILVEWSSDKDGPLCPRAPNDVTTHISCDSKGLSPGVHTITATVADPFGATASTSIRINAVSKPPSAFIIAPAPGATFFTGQQVNLRGFGSSPNENNIPDNRLVWSSSMGGVLPGGHDVWTKLKVGMQTITLTAIDAVGLTAQAKVNVNVKAGADVPTVKIVSPPDFESFGLGQMITFKGEGTDPIDGVLPGASLKWSSNIDGALGTGNTIQVKLSGGTMAPKQHVITLTGVNKAGQQATYTITVFVGTIG